MSKLINMEIKYTIEKSIDDSKYYIRRSEVRSPYVLKTEYLIPSYSTEEQAKTFIKQLILKELLKSD